MLAEPDQPEPRTFEAAISMLLSKVRGTTRMAYRIDRLSLSTGVYYDVRPSAIPPSLLEREEMLRNEIRIREIVREALEDGRKIYLKFNPQNGLYSLYPGFRGG